MKLLTLLFLFSIAIPLTANSEEIKAQSLAQGSCWVNKADDKVSFASFNQNIAVKLYGESFQQTANKIRTQLQETYQQEFDSKSLDLSIHCGTYGSSFVFNFNGGEHNLCVWAQIEDNEIKFNKIYASKKGERSICDGHKVGELIIKLATGTTIESIEHDAHLSVYIDKVEPIIEGVYKVYLKDKFLFKEIEVKQVFDQNSLLKSTDLNGLNHPVGESLLLYSLDL